MLKDAPIGSPLFYLYNILYLTFFTGIMTFGMLFIYYITYEAPNPLKDIEKILGNKMENYTITQDNILKSDIQHLEGAEKATLEAHFGNASEILRFNVVDKETSSPVMTIFSLSSGGFGGEVTSFVGTDGQTITALSVTDVSTETAGLGQRIAESAFQRQFIGKTREELPLDRSEWTTKSVDMISGATFSSASVVNNMLKAFDLYKLSGGN